MLLIYSTRQGKAYQADAIQVLAQQDDESVDLVITSPPFALQRKKSYGNVTPEEYAEWFMPFAHEIHRILKPSGSFVLDIGGSWNKGTPTRSLYHYDLLIRLCAPRGKFYLAQEFFWYNPAKMPAPAQWVTIERIRVKDAVQPIWWMSKSHRPKADNRRVLKPYTESMKKMLDAGYNDGERPSGHVVSTQWRKDQGGAIPPNLISAANTRSSDLYLDQCRKRGLMVHPARFVDAIPAFFVDFLTEECDLVFDPFAGSNVVGEVAERLGRAWISVEIDTHFAATSALRFDGIGDTVCSMYSESLRKV